MRFLMMVKADKSYEAGVPPNQELMAAVGKFSDELKQKGLLLGGEGLMPSAMGARIDVARGELHVTDGPFTEAKELIGGFAILQTKSKAEAIEVARQFMKVHADVLGPSYEGQCEIRQLYEPSHLPGKR